MYSSSFKLQEAARAGNGGGSISRKGEVAIMQEGFKSGKSRRRAGVTRSLPICSTAGRTKRRRGQRQRLGNPVLRGTTGSTITRGANSYTERFHCGLKQEEVWTAEYRSLEEASGSLARWVEEYNYDRPCGGVKNRTPPDCTKFAWPDCLAWGTKASSGNGDRHAGESLSRLRN